MRKYQQLLLLVISCFSVGILLMYKSENNRLKYVLQVVNFFGRNDAAVIMRLENSTKDSRFIDFFHPLPVWQQIGDAFHAYSAYWSRNQLEAGGEAITLVVAKRGAVVNFKCSVLYAKGKSISGKFKFFRIDADNVSDFSTYKFLCKLTRNFGVPERIVLTEISSKISQDLLLRHLKEVQTTPLEKATICMNMADFNATSSFATKTNLLQFFLYHQAVGIENFLVYNGDAIPYNIRHLLIKTSIKINYFPFNFPFASTPTAAIEQGKRQIIEADCLMRNINRAQYTFVLSANEFVYPSLNIDAKESVLRSLSHYESDITRFEMPAFAVCLYHKNKLLMDNTLYDPEVKLPHKLYVYKPNVADSHKSVALPLAKVVAHRYIECLRVGKDGLFDWRNSLREDFMKHLLLIRNEINFLI